jgi:hypothetical protein
MRTDGHGDAGAGEDSTKIRSLGDTLATLGDTCSGTYSAMTNEPMEIRCRGCGRLLAQVLNGQLTVERGALRTTPDGPFRTALVCPEPPCRRATSQPGPVLPPPPSLGTLSGRAVLRLVPAADAGPRKAR